MLGEQQSTVFDASMAAAHASTVAEVRQFARNMRNDEEAIQAALEYSWRQGQVEGQVHRLKLIKRAMYRRAKFDLLRPHVLHTT